MNGVRLLEKTGIALKETPKSQKEVFFNFLTLLMTVDLPLMKNVLRSLAKSILTSLGLAAAASAADASIQKKILRLGTITLVFSNEEIDDIMNIVKSLEESGLLIRCVSKTIKNEANEQKGWPFVMLLVALAVCLLGNMLAAKGVV